MTPSAPRTKRRPEPRPTDIVTASCLFAMTTPTCDACEIRIDGAWRSVSVAIAHARFASAIKRCPVCRGRVSIHVNSTAQGGLWLQHRKAHDGCPLMPARFAGELRMHPQALD